MAEAADLLLRVFPWLPLAFLVEVFLFQLIVLRKAEVTHRPDRGTPRELLPVSEKVLAWVHAQRKRHVAPIHPGVRRIGLIPLDDLRRIELCALATREACYFHDLYGTGDSGAAAPQVQDER